MEALLVICAMATVTYVVRIAIVMWYGFLQS